MRCVSWTATEATRQGVFKVSREDDRNIRAKLEVQAEKAHRIC